MLANWSISKRRTQRDPKTVEQQRRRIDARLPRRFRRARPDRPLDTVPRPAAATAHPGRTRRLIGPHDTLLTFVSGCFRSSNTQTPPGALQLAVCSDSGGPRPNTLILVV